MDDLALKIMYVMAEKIEALSERIEMAEAQIKDMERGCSCQTWREHTCIPRGVEWNVRLRPDAGDVPGNSGKLVD